MADAVRDEVKLGKYASVSEFFRALLRDWEKERVLADLRTSKRELRQGKVKILRSLEDLR